MSTKGVTLIEMMIAVSVLAVAIMGLLTTIAAAQRSNIVCEEERIALNAAMSRMEELRELPFAGIAGAYDPNSAGTWQFFDPRTAETRDYRMNTFAVVQAEPGGQPMYAIVPPLDPGGAGSLPHGEVVIVDSADELDENAYANDATPFRVDLDGQDSDGDGNGYNDNPADPGFVPGAGGLLAVVIVRWRSAATGTNRDIALRTVVANR